MYPRIQIGVDLFIFLNRVDVKQGVVRIAMTSIHAGTVNHYS